MYVLTDPNAVARRYEKLNFDRFRTNRQKRTDKRAAANQQRAADRKGGTNTQRED